MVDDRIDRPKDRLCPRITRSQYGGHTLTVDGKPFLMLAAELQNSSFSSREYMAGVWQGLKDCHINTIYVPVTWEAVEPSEGTFEFTKLDEAVLDARLHGIRLVLLWFGAFKNAKSTYVPAWVKTNASRFPRAELRKPAGVTQLADALSIFSPDLVKADAAAFKAVMRHIRKTDEAHSTILMMQVENEPGLLGDSRDSSPAANKQFSSPVPVDFLNSLREEWDLLHPRLRGRLHGFDKTGHIDKGLSWAEIFGKGPRCDELFMAYHFALYVETVAAAGKEEYTLPMFVNVWQNYGDEDADHAVPIVVGGGGEPGDYPSGGAVIDVLDIWQLFAPSLDFVAPDVYLNDYNTVCANYRHRGQALVIPEQRRDAYGARRVWSAYGTYGALCASPFGIDTLPAAENPWARHYRILAQASEYVLAAQVRPDISVGFYFDELEPADDASRPSKPFLATFGDWKLTINRAFVFGRPGPGFGMVIQLAPSQFLLLGEGFQVRFDSASDAAKFSGILSFTEKILDIETGKLVDGRVLNGDETRSGEVAIMPNAEPDYGRFPICVTIPARTGMAVCEVYALF